MENSLNFALHCDAEDPIKAYRDTYIIPQQDILYKSNPCGFFFVL